MARPLQAPDGVLKPIIEAGQQMMILLLFPVDWPDSLIALGTLLSGISLDFISFASPSCLGTPLNYYWRFMLLVIGTAIILSGGWVYSCLRYRRRNPAKWRSAIKARLRDTYLLVMLLHPTVSGQAFYHYRCQRVGNETHFKNYLMVDYTIECYDATWYAMLVPNLSVIVFFSLGVPLMFAETLRGQWYLPSGCRSNRREDDDEEEDEEEEEEGEEGEEGEEEEEEEEEGDDEEDDEEDNSTRRLLGIIFQSFKPGLHWFASVNMLFKLALYAILVFFDLGSQFQQATAAMLCFIQLGVHARYEPYKDPFKNWLQYMGLALVVTTASGGLVLNYLDVTKALHLALDDKIKAAATERQIEGFKTALEFVMWVGIAVATVQMVFYAFKFLKRNEVWLKRLLNKLCCCRCCCCRRNCRTTVAAVTVEASAVELGEIAAGFGGEEAAAGQDEVRAGVSMTDMQERVRRSRSDELGGGEWKDDGDNRVNPLNGTNPLTLKEFTRSKRDLRGGGHGGGAGGGGERGRGGEGDEEGVMGETTVEVEAIGVGGGAAERDAVVEVPRGEVEKGEIKDGNEEKNSSDMPSSSTTPGNRLSRLGKLTSIEM